MRLLKVCEKPLDGIIVIEMETVNDTAGSEMITYDVRDLSAIGILDIFVQENQSKSVKNVLRGMHFQQKYDQAQIVRVIEGKVYDVVVDIRRNSPTFGKYFGTYLTDNNHKMVYMSKGFAHGFLTISKYAVMHYKCSQFYHPQDEDRIRFDDPDVGIVWPCVEKSNLIISDKDMSAITLREYSRRIEGGRDENFMQSYGSGFPTLSE